MSTLRCPACNYECLHHERVEIFERREDAQRGLHVTVESGKVEIDQDIDENPSRRRHGLTIYFSCETCPKKSRLTLAQHKGASLVEFLEVEPEPECPF